MKFQNKAAGFTLLELLVVMGVLAIVFLVIAACGWGLAFTFATTVLVPWLGIPAAWAHAGALVLSLALTGVGTIIVAVVLLIIGTTVFGIGSAARRRR